MKINAEIAKNILLEESENEKIKPIDDQWKEKIDYFSKICDSTSKTHIAFLGTALLAKSVDIKADAFSVKASDDSEGAYSARGLAHAVLVPYAPRLNINLGVTGREPLNNQPYFRIKRLTKDVPVRGNARPAIDALLQLLELANNIDSTEHAREALRAFIHIRRKYIPLYEKLDENIIHLTCEQLSETINEFISENSEGGKRAQAVVAGILDLFAGIERVHSGRINDPDTHLPGDVGIRSKERTIGWEKVFEVRDKPVSIEDVYLFVQKALDNGVKDVAIVSVHQAQDFLDVKEIRDWATERGISITFFKGWFNFIEQVAFWSEPSQIKGLQLIPKLVYDRLIEIEASENAIKNWVNFFSINDIAKNATNE